MDNSRTLFDVRIIQGKPQKEQMNKLLYFHMGIAMAQFILVVLLMVDYHTRAEKVFFLAAVVLCMRRLTMVVNDVLFIKDKPFIISPHVIRYDNIKHLPLILVLAEIGTILFGVIRVIIRYKSLTKDADLISLLAFVVIPVGALLMTYVHQEEKRLYDQISRGDIIEVDLHPG